MKSAFKWLNKKFSVLVLTLFYLVVILPVWLFIVVVGLLKGSGKKSGWEKIDYKNENDYFESAY